MLYNEDGTPFPSCWAICSHCRGDGKSSAYLGAFSREDFNEDPDFAEAYMNGEYDRMCDECKGSGKVQLIDVSRCTYAQKRAMVKQRRSERDAAYHRMEQESEMRMLHGLEY